MIFRGREREICCSTDSCIHWLLPVYALTRDRTCNLGTSEQHSNRDPWPGQTMMFKQMSYFVKPFALIKNHCGCPGWYGSVGWGSSCRTKGHWFDSWTGRMPGLQVWSPGRMRSRDNGSMFLSHINVSLHLFLPSCPSL